MIRGYSPFVETGPLAHPDTEMTPLPSSWTAALTRISDCAAFETVAGERLNDSRVGGEVSQSWLATSNEAREACGESLETYVMLPALSAARSCWRTHCSASCGQIGA